MLLLVVSSKGGRWSLATAAACLRPFGERFGEDRRLGKEPDRGEMMGTVGEMIGKVPKCPTSSAAAARPLSLSLSPSRLPAPCPSSYGP